MERLSVIMGRRQEGKTTELLSGYAHHFAADYHSDLSNKIDLKPVFITCASKDEDFDTDVYFNNLLTTLEESDFTPSQWEMITTRVHIVHNRFTKDDIEQTILYYLEMSDCVIYLDNCDELITVEQAANWISDYSMVDEYNNLDIVMTKNK